jgi:hypothetical protein
VLIATKKVFATIGAMLTTVPRNPNEWVVPDLPVEGDVRIERVVRMDGGDPRQ